MSRRKRKIMLMSLMSTVILVVTVWFVWADQKTQQYLPGEHVEGLTSRLDREVPLDYSPVVFQDVTQEAGINFSHFGHDRTSQLPEDMGSGAVWLDYNNDDWDDLFIVNFSAPLIDNLNTASTELGRCKLYKNNGDGTFQDVSDGSGLDLAIRGMGAAAADYDNDGLIDLFVTAYGENILMKNKGNGTFSNVTKQAGVNHSPGFWAGASWGDYNRDGYVDLYVTGYVKYVDFKLPKNELVAEEPPSINPSSFRPERNFLYKNNGDGTFAEVARETGTENKSGRSLSASWTDVNNDLWPDLYVANDVSDNVLFLNNRDGTFSDISHQAYVADYRGAMGIAGGDWDNDQDMDLFITHWLAQENALYTNRWNDTLQSSTVHSLQFKDDSAVHGLGQSSLDYVGWATSFLDLDLDSRLDLFVINGSTNQVSEEPVKLESMKDQVYWNAGRQRGFYEVSRLSGIYFSDEYVGRGGAFSDYDRDGDLDLFIVNHNGPAILLNNETSRQNNWLTVRLEGKASNRSAVGAQLRLVSGDDVQIRQIGSQSSYLSQNTLAEHFGLGTNQNVDTLEIIWPSGVRDLYLNLSPRQTLKLKEGEADLSHPSAKRAH